MKMRLTVLEAEGDPALVGNLIAEVLSPPMTPAEGAAAYLRERGHEVGVAPGIVPGLWLLDGREITTGQMLSLANGSL